jgi:DNA-directed RNA polymerase alpha subunit
MSMPDGGLPPGLGLPAQRALEAAGITRLGQLTQHSEAELRGLHGLGPKAIGLLREALALRGLTFRQDDGPRL